jgi:hypothetical protein
LFPILDILNLCSDSAVNFKLHVIAGHKKLKFFGLLDRT